MKSRSCSSHLFAVISGVCVRVCVYMCERVCVWCEGVYTCVCVCGGGGGVCECMKNSSY